jgi:hypothetical protein
MDFIRFSKIIAILSINSIKHLIFVVVKYSVLFEVRTEFLNIIQTNFKNDALSLSLSLSLPLSLSLSRGSGFTVLYSVNHLIFVMVKCGVLFEVRTGFLNVIYTNFDFEG